MRPNTGTAAGLAIAGLAIPPYEPCKQSKRN